MIMLRKALIVLAAAASVGLLAPGIAQARGGGGHGGGGHGGGGHGFGGGGFHGGGGFRGGGFHGGFGRGVGFGALGLGLGLGYGYYGGYGYPYYDGYYADDGGCYVVRRRIPVSYTHLRAHETGRNLVCRLLL